jgi:hypothetical protein
MEKHDYLKKLEMELPEYLTKLHTRHRVIRIQQGGKAPISGEVVGSGVGSSCSIESWLKHDGNYGVRTGKIAEGFEVIDFDPKNYGGSSVDKKEIIKRSGVLMKQYKLLVKEQDGGKELLTKLPMIRTPSGGYHFYFKSNHIEGNKKLAMNTDKGAFIETRGEGGLVVCFPSPGYEVILNNALDVPHLEQDERLLLLDSARALTEYYDDAQHTFESKNAYLSNTDSPFVAACMDGNAYLDHLASDGWVVVSSNAGEYKLRRPDKDAGISAQFSMQPRVGIYPFLYNHSSSTKLDSGKRYNYTQYLLEMEFGGDKKALAEALVRRGFGKDKYRSQPKSMHVVQDLSTDTDTFWEEISKEIVNQDSVVPAEPPVIYMKDQLFLTEGNLAGVAGVQKTGKSALANAIISKLINPDIPDFPAIRVTPHKGKGVILVDTEQSRAKLKHNVVGWQLKRAKTAKLPENFINVSFRSFTIAQSRDYLAQLMKVVSDKHGGLHLVVIDGGADFVTTVNNLEEVTAFMKLLSELCTIYECAILLNIHTNPSSVHTGDHKPTGHLGSALLKKCESVILINTDQYNKAFSVITALALRNGNREEFGDIYYQYDKELGYHRQIVDEQAAELHIENKNLTLLANVQRICMGSEMNDAMLDCMTEFDWSVSQAKKKIRECINLKFLVVDGLILKKSGKMNTNDDFNLDGDAPF